MVGRTVLGASLVLLVVVYTAVALDNGLGRTPQMGWNPYNTFGWNVNDTVVRKCAKAIVDSPLKAAGYEYVNLDDAWAKYRDSDGIIHPDPVDFPEGIASLATYVHSLGLKFGIYSDAGTETCAGRPGSLGYEKNDANTYASWGVDYLKYDNCHSGTESPMERYPVMRDALNATGRHIFFSLCEWGVDNPATWAPEVGNSWRTTTDIRATWASILNNLDENNEWYKQAGPGGWNDPDMLEVGNDGLTTTEQISHFSLWAISKSPLILGLNVLAISAETLTIITNSEVIALNQDPLGVQARVVTNTEDSYSVVATTCQGNAYQKWTVNSRDKTIRHVATGKCLEIPNCSTDSGTQLELADCHVGSPNQQCKSLNQQWRLNGDGSITSELDGKCADKHPLVGSVVQTSSCTGGTSQKWSYDATTRTISSEQVCLGSGASTGQVYAGPLVDKSIAVLLFNRGATNQSISAPWTDIGLEKTAKATVRDLWLHKDLGTFSGNFTANIASHGVVVLKVTPL